MENKVIAIEGLVGAGKTSICRNLLTKIPNSILINGGNIYRSIVYAMIRNGDKLEAIEGKGKSLDIKDMMDLFNINIRIENQETILYLGDEKISEELLQSKENSLAVSHVGGSADNKKLFEFARNLIDELRKKHNIILSGRSLMIIYPASDYHLFITASLDARVRRKCTQYGNKDEYEEIKKNIEERDELQRKAGFYDFSPITKEIDVTDCKTVEESTEKVLSYIQ